MSGKREERLSGVMECQCVNARRVRSRELRIYILWVSHEPDDEEPANAFGLELTVWPCVVQPPVQPVLSVSSPMLCAAAGSANASATKVPSGRLIEYFRTSIRAPRSRDPTIYSSRRNRYDSMFAENENLVHGSLKLPNSETAKLREKGVVMNGVCDCDE